MAETKNFTAQVVFGGKGIGQFSSLLRRKIDELDADTLNFFRTWGKPNNARHRRRKKSKQYLRYTQIRKARRWR